MTVNVNNMLWELDEEAVPCHPLKMSLEALPP